MGIVAMLLVAVRPEWQAVLARHTPHAIKVAVIWPLESLAKEQIFTLGMPIALLVTMATELLWPVDPRQGVISVGLMQDAVWCVYETVLRAIVVVTYVHWLGVGYHRWFEFLTIDSVNDWPAWLRFTVGVVFLDFLYWVQHFLNHKSPLLWRFHAVHHSQEQLNFFTDFRYHLFEYLVRFTILTIPFLVLSIRIPTIVVISQVLQWYTRFYHGNIRTNLGPLRYVLVTPQSHRLHHSRLPEHFDSNFGSVLSIWDRLFGTAHPAVHDYPPTGIPDRAFPVERRADLLSLPWLPLKQMLYPFRPRSDGPATLVGRDEVD